MSNNEDYIHSMITDFFNILVSNCKVIDGSKPLKEGLFDDILTVQYDGKNNVVFIETPNFNYCLVEDGDQLKLSEFGRGVDLKEYC